MGVDDEGVGFCQGAVGRGGDQSGLEVREQAVEAAVGRVDVHAHAVGAGEGENPVERVEGADAGGAERRDEGADAARLEGRFETGEVQAAVGVDVEGDRLDAQDLGHAAVGVVGLAGIRDGLPRVQLPGDPEGF
ncbi:hypothetical protein D3C72_962660 [compost metagenome]